MTDAARQPDRTIHVINASSRTDTGITDELARSLSWCRGPRLPAICCVTLEDGPNGITTARDSAEAAPAVLSYIERHHGDPGCAGFVVACFSDPGVHEAGELTAKPVVGIGGAGLGTAAAIGPHVGTIGVSRGSGRKTRHLAMQYGLGQTLAGHRELGLDYADLQDPDVMTTALIEAGIALRDGKQADVLLFAGAGLARYVQPVQQAVGLPTIDPTQAALCMVMGQVMAARAC